MAKTKEDREREEFLERINARLPGVKAKQAKVGKRMKKREEKCKLREYTERLEALARDHEKPMQKRKPCKPGQVRNPLTNRCKKETRDPPDQISEMLAAMTQKPCKPGQERNPLTNRCKKTRKLRQYTDQDEETKLREYTERLEALARDQEEETKLREYTERLEALARDQEEELDQEAEMVAAMTQTQKPCKPGQVRNPLTKRCKKACRPDQFLDPVTNRCKSSKKTTKRVNKKISQVVNGETWWFEVPARPARKDRQLPPCGPGKFRNPITNRCKKTSNKVPSQIPAAIKKTKSTSEDKKKEKERKDFLDRVNKRLSGVEKKQENVRLKLLKKEEKKTIAEAKIFLKTAQRQKRKEDKTAKKNIKVIKDLNTELIELEKERQFHEMEMKKKNEEEKLAQEKMELDIARDKEALEKAKKKYTDKNANIIKSFVKRVGSKLKKLEMIKKNEQKRKDEEKTIQDKLEEERRSKEIEKQYGYDSIDQYEAVRNKFENEKREIENQIRNIQMGTEDDFTISRGQSKGKKLHDLKKKMRQAEATLDNQIFLISSSGNKCLITNEKLCDNHFFWKNHQKRYVPNFKNDSGVDLTHGSGVCQDDHGVKMSTSIDNNNCLYLSKTLNLYPDYVLFKFVAKGSYNAVYKAMSRKVTKENNNDGYAVRVSTIGYDSSTIATFNYSGHIQNLAYERLKNKIKIPRNYKHEIVKIGKKEAGVQVQDFLIGTELSDLFRDQNENDKLDVLARMYGRTLAFMHKNNLAHGDAHSGNFMSFDKENYHRERYLTPVDLDRCIDLQKLSACDVKKSTQYDLTNAFYSLHRDNLKKEFTSAYLKEMEKNPLNNIPLWKEYPHTREDLINAWNAFRPLWIKAYRYF